MNFFLVIGAEEGPLCDMTFMYVQEEMGRKLTSRIWHNKGTFRPASN